MNSFAVLQILLLDNASVFDQFTKLSGMLPLLMSLPLFPHGGTSFLDFHPSLQLLASPKVVSILPSESSDLFYSVAQQLLQEQDGHRHVSACRTHHDSDKSLLRSPTWFERNTW